MFGGSFSRMTTAERMSRKTQEQDGGSRGSVVMERKTKTTVSPPKMYKVLLHNDDYTPMDFVVAALEVFFHHSHEQAVKIMLQVHHNGVGVAGVFTHEIAESKTAKVLAAAKEAGFPLLCTYEPDA